MRIDKSLFPLFVLWLKRGSHSITEKKGKLTASKNGKTGTIKTNYELCGYLQSRYVMFLEQYFRIGKKFITDLEELYRKIDNLNKNTRYVGIVCKLEKTQFDWVRK